MVSIPADLTAFLAEKRDSREYRRALAVKLALLGYRYEAICEMLDVTIGFVSQSKKAYETHGTAGLTLKYQGTQPYLSASERQAVIDWLKNEHEWSVEHLQDHIQTTYDVVFQSRQSYYQLLADAEITYKRAQRSNPKTDPEQVAAKKKIIERLSAYASEIREGSVVVLYLDECHLLWDDARGYSWAPSTQRVEVPMTNFRERQTYYGAIDPVNGTVHVIPTDNADGNWTMIFVEYLRQEYGEKRLFLLWDGASYHRGVDMQDYLDGVNLHLARDAWRVTCILFAPNAPSQNPIEDVWLKAKQYLRKYWSLCRHFKDVMRLFEEAFGKLAFRFEKLHMYLPFL
jgi:putative transposase